MYHLCHILLFGFELFVRYELPLSCDLAARHQDLKLFNQFADTRREQHTRHVNVDSSHSVSGQSFSREGTFDW